MVRSRRVIRLEPDRAGYSPRLPHSVSPIARWVRVLARGVLARGVLARGVLARGVLARGVLARGVLARGVLARGVP
jgi:hypothetical protein